ncbi:hypothetical protein [Roseivirga pacifica]|nr:hypothetical protein [Roseivirga pacifica]
MTRYLVLSLMICTALALWSCGEDVAAEKPTDPDQGKTYFYLKEGQYRIYNVYEIKYEAVDMSDTLEYQIREEVGEPFNNNGSTSHTIRRYSRLNSQESWELDSIWSARVEEDIAVSVENNVPFVKLVFPAIEGREWDRNIFNVQPETDTKILSFDEPYTVGLNTFLHAMEVEISNLDDIIVSKDVRYEVYADSIGLVKKEYNQLLYCSTAGQCEIGAGIIQSGKYYRETLIESGNIYDVEED